MSSYEKFETEEEYDTDDVSDIPLRVGSFCYDAHSRFCVITKIASHDHECNVDIIDLARQERKKVISSTLKLIKNTKHLQKAQQMHQRYLKHERLSSVVTHPTSSTSSTSRKSSKRSNACNVELTSKEKRDQKVEEISSSAQEIFCGPKCCVHAVYGIFITLSLIALFFAIWFLNYGMPMVDNGKDFQQTLAKSTCSVFRYEIIDCNYECYKCDDIARCSKCDGPWCNTCSGGQYKYYATSAICNDDSVHLESRLDFNDCPEMNGQRLTMGTAYDCYVAVNENNECEYNGEALFVFDDDDQGIPVGQKYVDVGYVCISCSALSMFVVFAVCCRKCIKSLPCMN